MSATRAGIGFDAHRFTTGGRLVIGGVEIPHRAGLEGHSDADVLSHAVIDALLGAAGLGDIGAAFPAEDRWKDASSLEMLGIVGQMLAAEGLAILSVDAVVIAAEPQIAPYRAAMRARLAEVLGIAEASVSVKATTTDGMGFTGRGEGIAAQSVALLGPKSP